MRDFSSVSCVCVCVLSKTRARNTTAPHLSEKEKTLLQQAMPLPEAAAGDTVVRIVCVRGGNVLEVCDASGCSSLALLPTRFKNVIWVKRGDFLIAATHVQDGEANASKMKFIVTHVLYPEQIKHIKKHDLWRELPRGDSFAFRTMLEV